MYGKAEKKIVRFRERFTKEKKANNPLMYIKKRSVTIMMRNEQREQKHTD